MEMEQTIGSKHLLKRYEFIKLIIDALNSLGFDRIGTLFEQESGIPLHNETTKQFMRQVKDAKWDKSILTLKEFHLRDENSAKFLLLEQKFFEFLRIKGTHTAISVLSEEIVPLGVNANRVDELATKLILGLSEEDRASRSTILEKLQKLFPPIGIVPERRLEYLLETIIDSQQLSCDFHNIPDSELSLYSDHHCGNRKIPSKTVQTLEAHTDEVWFLKFSHNGKYLASSSKDKMTIIWEINAEGKFQQKRQLLGHREPVVAVLWSPDDRQVVTCGENEHIIVWDVETGFYRMYGRNGVRSVSCGWFHDGSRVNGGMADRRIYLWNLDWSEVQHQQGQRAQKLSDVVMTTDGKWLVSVGSEHEISLFDRETRVERVFQAEDMITSFSLSSDNKHLLIYLIAQKIDLWNIEGEPHKVMEFAGHKRTRFIIRSCFGGYKESFIASGSEDSQVYI